MLIVQCRLCHTGPFQSSGPPQDIEDWILSFWWTFNTHRGGNRGGCRVNAFSNRRIKEIFMLPPCFKETFRNRNRNRNRECNAQSVNIRSTLGRTTGIYATFIDTNITNGCELYGMNRMYAVHAPLTQRKRVEIETCEIGRKHMEQIETSQFNHIGSFSWQKYVLN